MKFKTNAKCGGCVAAIGEKLNQVIKADEWSIDLNTSDRELTVSADVSPEIIITAVKEAGFKAEQL